MLKRFKGTLGCIAALLFSIPAVAQQPPDLDVEAAAIKQTLTSCRNAFKSRDARAAAMCFTEDADFTGASGKTVHGRKEIEQLFEKSFAKRPTDTHREYTIKKIRFLSPQIATVENAWQDPGSHANGSPITPYAGVQSSPPLMPNGGVHTLVVIKEKGNWRITIFHGSRFRPRE